MTTRSSRDRAAMVLGGASIASLLFLVIKRELHFIEIPKAGIVIAVVLGLLAIAGGWLASRLLVALAGAGFAVAAALQVILQTAGSSLARGSNGSTLGLWLGLAAGLLALALTPNETVRS